AEPLIVELDIDDVNSNSYAYLVDQQSGAVLLDDGKPGFTAPQQVSALLSSSGTATYNGARDQNVIGAVLPVTLKESGDALGWAVVVEQPANVAPASVRRSVLLLTLLVIVAGLLGV